MKKRLLPALLALVMVLGMLPLSVFAAAGDAPNLYAGISATGEAVLTDVKKIEEFKDITSAGVADSDKDVEDILWFAMSGLDTSKTYTLSMKCGTDEVLNAKSITLAEDSGLTSPDFKPDSARYLIYLSLNIEAQYNKSNLKAGDCTITLKEQNGTDAVATVNATLAESGETWTLTMKSEPDPESEITASAATRAEAIDGAFATGAPTKDFQTITVTLFDDTENNYKDYNHVYKVAGSLEFVEGWTGYSEAEQNGYFGAIKLENVPEGTKYSVGGDVANEGTVGNDGIIVALTNIATSTDGLTKNSDNEFTFTLENGKQKAMLITVGEDDAAETYVFLFGEVVAKTAAAETVTITYNVSKVPNGASVTVPNAVEITKGGSLTDTQLAAAPTGTVSGYKFDGWYKEEALTTKVTTADTFAEDANIYGKWVEDTTNPETGALVIQNLDSNITELVGGMDPAKLGKFVIEQDATDKTRVTVTGSANYVEWAAFNGSVAAEQEGHYLAIQIKGAKDQKITVTNVSDGAKAPGKEMTFGADGSFEMGIWLDGDRTGDLSDALKKGFTVATGEGDDAVTYTVDFSGVVLLPEVKTGDGAGTTKVEVPAKEADKLSNLIKDTEATGTATTTDAPVQVIVENGDKTLTFNATAEDGQENKGHAVTLPSALASAMGNQSGDSKADVQVNSGVGSVTIPSAALTGVSADVTVSIKETTGAAETLDSKTISTTDGEALTAEEKTTLTTAITGAKGVAVEAKKGTEDLLAEDNDAAVTIIINGLDNTKIYVLLCVSEDNVTSFGEYKNVTQIVLKSKHLTDWIPVVKTDDTAPVLAKIAADEGKVDDVPPAGQNYTVSFNNNGGTGTIDAVTKAKAAEGATVIEFTNTFAKTGYTLAGWTIATAEGATVVKGDDNKWTLTIPDTVEAGAITLTARWTKNATCSIAQDTFNAEHENTTNQYLLGAQITLSDLEAGTYVCQLTFVNGDKQACAATKFTLDTDGNYKLDTLPLEGTQKYIVQLWKAEGDASVLSNYLSVSVGTAVLSKP